MTSLILLCLLVIFIIIAVLCVIFFFNTKNAKTENFKSRNPKREITLVVKDNCIDCHRFEREFDHVAENNKEHIMEHNIILKKYNMSNTEIPSNVSKYIIDIPCVMLFTDDQFVHENHGENSIENFMHFLGTTDILETNDETISESF